MTRPDSLEFHPREKRVEVTLRLAQSVLDVLEKQASSRGLSLVVYLEKILVEQAGPSGEE